MDRKKSMTIKDFLAEYNEAPFSLDEVASLIYSKLTGSGKDVAELRALAEHYESARDTLVEALENIGYEFG